MASNLTVDNLFDSAMEATATGLGIAGFASDKPWNTLLPKLKSVIGTTFDAAHYSVLDDLRKAIREAEKKGTKEGPFLLVGGGVDVGSTAIAAKPDVQRCAALKLLRHTYFHAKRANHKMWIVSLPSTYSAWPDRHLAGSVPQMCAKLGENTEQFSHEQRQHLSDATLHGLRWVLKAQCALDDLKDKSKGLKLLKRWFADEDSTDEQLRNFASATLKDGLKKVASKMSAGTLILTDFVPIRHSADATDAKAAAANAFVTADTRDVVYIEKGFFTKDASSVFQKDARHWARIMVHELTHREAKTDDKRYGWAGIKPIKGTFSSATAMVNADSWALFVADAAGAMTKTDLSRALNGTVD